MRSMEKLLIASALSVGVLGTYLAKYVAGNIVSDMQDQYERLGEPTWRK
jgi:hypothetical protein